MPCFATAPEAWEDTGEPNQRPKRKRQKTGPLTKGGASGSAPSPSLEKIPAATLVADGLVDRVRSLEKAIHESKANLNGLVELLELCEYKCCKVRHAAIHALHRIFIVPLDKGELVRPKEGKHMKRAEAKGKATDSRRAKPTLPEVSNWLRDNYLQYIDILISLLSSAEPGLQVPALNLLMDILRREATQSARLRNGEPEFPNHFYSNMVAALAYNANFSEQLRDCLVEKYLVIYDDLRFFMYKVLMKVINDALAERASSTSVRMPANAPPVKLTMVTKMETVIENVFSILNCFRTMPTVQSEVDEFWTGHPRPVLKDQIADAHLASEQEDSDGAGKQKQSKSATPPLLLLSAHRRVFSDAWLAFLRLPLPVDLYKKVLLIMHKKIIPHMTRPTVLIDFLTDSYNAGGVVSLLALNGLFTLINEHNLDYPEFYTKLYALLDYDVMHVKYRSRFFRMLDMFLTSTHLPAYLVAAFVKRLARLSLAAPPAADVVIIPLIYNLLKRHPTLMKLIHRAAKGGLFGEDTEGNKDAEGVDPYDPQERDLVCCRALDSSLWELASLRSHYAPNVSSLAKMFEEKFNKPGYSLEDFLDHTYATMFEADISRPLKKTPAVTFETQMGLTEEGAGYSEIWAFD